MSRARPRGCTPICTASKAICRTRATGIVPPASRSPPASSKPSGARSLPRCLGPEGCARACGQRANRGVDLRPIRKPEAVVTEAQASQTRATLKDLYGAYREGNAERVAALIDEDIDWCIYGPARVFPFEGPRRGKAQVIDVLAAIGAQYELKRHDQEIMVVEGERAAVLSQAAFVQRATGRTLSMRLIN